MCQLCFINLHNKELNTLLAVSQALSNTREDHKDGFGFFANGKISKYGESPWVMLNYAKHAKENISENPVLLHVRKASWTGSSKFLDEDHAHPFESKNFIFAHNGVFDPIIKNAYSGEEYKDKIDSQIFLVELDREYEKVQDFTTALKNTTMKFYGKFAMLVYEKKTGNYYCIRDDIATLFTYKINILKRNEKNREVSFTKGYIVNTQKDTLISGMVAFSNYLFLHGYRLEWSGLVNNVTEIAANSVNLLMEDKIKFISRIESAKKPVETKPAASAANFSHRGGNFRTIPTSSINDIDIYKIDDDSILEECRKNFMCFMDKFNVSLWYLDILCYFINGKSLVYLCRKEIIIFSEFLKHLEDKIIIPEEMRKDWAEIRKDIFSELHIHEKDSTLEFPYFLNTSAKLHSSWDKIKNSGKLLLQ